VGLFHAHLRKLKVFRLEVFQVQYGVNLHKGANSDVGESSRIFRAQNKKIPLWAFAVHQGADEIHLCRLVFTLESRIPYLGLLMGDHHH